MDQNFKEIYAAAKDVRAVGANYLEVRPTFPTDWRGDGWGNALSDPDAAKVEVDHARLHLNSASFRVIGMTERFDAVSQPRKNYDQCRIGGLTTVIGADGRLWHCCVQRGQQFFELGSIKEKPFREEWTRIHGVRQAGKIDVSRCPRCRYDGYNELIQKAFLTDGLHSSFV
jgi:MoaA/NifB/PqqE/SkfB family radical SAM enzyme